MSDTETIQRLLAAEIKRLEQLAGHLNIQRLTGEANEQRAAPNENEEESLQASEAAAGTRIMIPGIEIEKKKSSDQVDVGRVLKRGEL